MILSDFAFLLANIFLAAALSKSRVGWLWISWGIYMVIFAILIYNGC
jgi:hypothetical protein